MDPDDIKFHALCTKYASLGACGSCAIRLAISTIEKRRGAPLLMEPVGCRDGEKCVNRVIRGLRGERGPGVPAVAAAPAVLSVQPPRNGGPPQDGGGNGNPGS